MTPVTEPAVEPLPEGIPKKCWWRGSYPWAQVNHYPNGDLNINMLPTMEGDEFLRLGYDAAMQECRRRVRGHWHYWQTTYEEFRRFRLCWIAPALGVRESRRIVGEYVLTENDLAAGLSRQKHADIIALADHSMDTHGGHAKGGEMRRALRHSLSLLDPKRAEELAGGVSGGELQFAGRVELPAVSHHGSTGSGRWNGGRAGKATEGGSARRTGRTAARSTSHATRAA